MYIYIYIYIYIFTGRRAPIPRGRGTFASREFCLPPRCFCGGFAAETVVFHGEMTQRRRRSMAEI